MEIVVLNGSPKGEASVTMQYVAYLGKKHPGHRTRVFNVSHDIQSIARDPAVFGTITGAVRSADLVLWAFPVYHMLVPSQYKRFIELVFAGEGKDAFAGKDAAVLSTSIHFFDHTAHAYMHAVCDDLSMRFCGAYSAAMYDLLDAGERERFGKFLDGLFREAGSGIPVPREYPPLEQARWDYVPATPVHALPVSGRKVVILTDSDGTSPNLDAMTRRLMENFAGSATLVNLREAEIRGGCLGCCRCGYDNTCVYTDGYRDLYTRVLGGAEIIVMAGAVRDRDLSWAWKQFFDRSFFLGHTPGLAGKQVGYCIAGPLPQLANMKEVLEARADLGGNRALFVSDEPGDARVLDGLIDAMAARLLSGAGSGYVPPPTFRAVAGYKLFRDAIYGSMRIAFRADYRYYRQHGLFDFPQKDIRGRCMNGVLGTLMCVPGFRKKVLAEMKEHMIAPFRDVLAKT